MNDRDETLLRDMLDEAYRVQKFVHGRTREDLNSDDLLSYAVVHAIQIIGEAASKVTAETRTQYATIPWRNIIGIRNRIVHDYGGIDLDIVWEVATRNLPDLIRVLQEVFSPPDS